MKILIYKAQTRLGQLLLTRLKRAGHRVVAVYTNSADMPLESRPKLIWYKVNSGEKLRDVLRYETPELLLDADLPDYHQPENNEKRIGAVSDLAKLSAETGVHKMLLLSSVEVYGDNLCGPVTEETEAEPISPAGKTAYACENILLGFRKDARFVNVIYRIGTVWGDEAAQDTWNRSLIQAAESGREFVPQNGGLQIPIFVGDLADAMVRAVSDNVYGLYNVCGQEVCSEEKIYNLAIKALHRGQDLISVPPVFWQAPHCDKLEHEAGWVRFYTAQAAFNRLFEQYQKEKTDSSEPGSPVKDTTRKPGNRLRGYLESTLLFAGLAFAMSHIPSNSTQNLPLLYCVGASVFGGVGHGLYAAVLMSGYEIWEMLAMGFEPVTLVFNYNFLLKVIALYVVAVCIGYVVERKNTQLAQATETVAALQEENDRISEMNEDLARIKNFQEEKLLRYEDGLARLYSVFAGVKMTSVNEVLLRAPFVVKKLTREENVSIYIVQRSSGFMRRFTYIGAPPRNLPSSFRYVDVEEYDRIVRKGQFYVNRHMDQEMPGIIVPIMIREKTAALLVIPTVTLAQMTRYYLNMMKLAGAILSDFCNKTALHEQSVAELTYEPESHILKREFFRQSCDTALKAAQKTGFECTILELISTHEQIDVEKARSLLRNSDEIGRLPEGGLGILLYGTNAENARLVQARLQDAGLESRKL